MSEAYRFPQMSASQEQVTAALSIAVFALEIGHDFSPTHLALHYYFNVYPYDVAIPFFSSPTDHLPYLAMFSPYRDQAQVAYW